MTADGEARPTLKKLSGLGRRAVGAAGAEMVRSRPLDGHGLPLLVEPALEGLDACGWAAENRGWIEERLLAHGGILFRGFPFAGAADLERFIEAVSGAALEYRERSSPRSAVEGNIYTSTDYPPDQPIFLHNENSYQQTWPLKIFFLCVRPAATGGATPIADCRRVGSRIDPDVRERFRARGWMVVRNFGTGFGLAWTTVFQTDDRRQVEAHCRRGGIDVEWRAGDRLRTRAVRPALTAHPKTGEPIWFNHATFFHVSTLEQSVREPLLAEFGEDELPTNTFYGDGSPIEPEVLDHLRAAYRAETVRFDWQRGDLLMLDNMLVAHGREPYAGERRVLVGMAEPVSRDADRRAVEAAP
jgi:alpha-ketoglutarate-dependent taurine dioxygenase